MKPPTAKEVKAARLAKKQTVREAAESIWASIKTWYAWENGTRNMPRAKFSLYKSLQGGKK